MTHSGRQIILRKADGTATLWVTSEIRPEVKRSFDEARQEIRKLNRDSIARIKKAKAADSSGE